MASMRLKQLNNLDTKVTKRCVNKWAKKGLCRLFIHLKPNESLTSSFWQICREKIAQPKKITLKIGLKSGKIYESGTIKEFDDWFNQEMIVNMGMLIFSC